MAVAFDAVGPSSAGAGSTGSSTLSWTHTNVASGVDVLVGCAVDAGSDTGITATCTVGGTSATSLGKIEAGSGGSGFLQVWRLTGVGSGAQTVTVTCSGGSTPGDMTGGSMSFTGVVSIGTPVTLANTSTNPSLNVTGVASTSMVAGFAGCGNTIGSPSGGGTSRFVNNLMGGAGSATGNAAGSTNTGTGTVAIGWTSTSTSNALLGVELQAGSDGAPAVPQQGRSRFRQRRSPRQLARQMPWALSMDAAAVQAGPPVTPLQGPVRARVPQLFLKGRVTGSSDGTRAQAGPPVAALNGPVATRAGARGLPLRGRKGSNAGTFGQAGPPVTLRRGPVMARVPSLLRGGRVQSRAGTYAQLGPPVTPAHGPVRAKAPLPPRGRAQGRSGTFTSAAPQAGPPVYPLHGPVQARLPLQPLRPGRTGTMVALALFYAGPPVTPLHGPVRTRPQPPLRGRAQGRAGTFTATAPTSGPPVYPLHGPVRTRPQPPPRGRCQSRAGTFTQSAIQSGPPVYPLHGPVRTRPQPPPRGRCAGNRGSRAQTGPPVTPLRGPVAPFRPGPYRSGRCAANRGTRAQLGPAVRALPGPVRSRVPHRTRGGHCTGNPGAPVFVPPFTVGRLTAATAAQGTQAPRDAALGAVTARTAAQGGITG